MTSIPNWRPEDPYFACERRGPDERRGFQASAGREERLERDGAVREALDTGAIHGTPEGWRAPVTSERV